MALKLGINLGYWSPEGPPPGAKELVAEADRLGLDSVWTAEAYGSDVLTPLAWWGAQTRRIRLGTAIAQLSAREPAATAMAAITMDHLSQGRFELGIGRGDRRRHRRRTRVRRRREQPVRRPRPGTRRVEGARRSGPGASRRSRLRSWSWLDSERAQGRL